MSPLLGCDCDVGATNHVTDGFAAFFLRKIESVRFDTAGLPPPPIINNLLYVLLLLLLVKRILRATISRS
jgi:hypothetical protein